MLFGALSLLALVSYRGFEFLPLQRILRLFSRHSKIRTPIARERAIEEMATGFMMIDHASRIVDINPMGSDTQRVDLGAVATEAWNTVDAADATLSIDVDVTVDGDPSRLRQAFENRFRNAIEHGGSDVSVTVGEFDGGFFVADDGPGLPPGQRAEVLEEGFTTSEDGTGFGLSIVQTIVEAHVWKLAVTENETDTTASEGSGGSEDE